MSVFQHRQSMFYSLARKQLTILSVIVAEPRMSYFVVGLTNDNPEITAPVYKQYHHVQYNEKFPASATASVSFPPSPDTFRYVVIQQQFPNTGAICMNEVQVFLRGSLSYFVPQTFLNKCKHNVHPQSLIVLNVNCQFFITNEDHFMLTTETWKRHTNNRLCIVYMRFCALVQFTL